MEEEEEERKMIEKERILQRLNRVRNAH